MAQRAILLSSRSLNGREFPQSILKFLTATEEEAKQYLAKFGVNDSQVEIWGSGLPRREFLYVDDLAKALVFLMDNYDDHIPINIGTGKDLPIKDLVEIIKDVTEFDGKVIWNTAFCLF